MLSLCYQFANILLLLVGGHALYGLLQGNFLIFRHVFGQFIQLFLQLFTVVNLGTTDFLFCFRVKFLLFIRIEPCYEIFNSGHNIHDTQMCFLKFFLANLKVLIGLEHS